MPHIDCNSDYTAYVNLGDSPTTVTAQVKDHCGGRATLKRIDKDGIDVPNSTLNFGPGGGMITLQVESGESVIVTCSGHTHEGCEINIEHVIAPLNIPSDDISRKLDLILRRLSTSSKTGLIWGALSNASDKLRLDVEPDVKNILSLIEENRDRITQLEDVMKQILEKLKRL